MSTNSPRPSIRVLTIPRRWRAGFSRAGCGLAMAKTDTGRCVLVVAILGSSMAFIDGTVVNIALPALQTALQATISQVQWVIESYALFLAALLLTGGSLGDI